jgi:hypothetical protein
VTQIRAKTGSLLLLALKLPTYLLSLITLRTLHKGIAPSGTVRQAKEKYHSDTLAYSLSCRQAVLAEETKKFYDLTLDHPLRLAITEFY